MRSTYFAYDQETAKNSRPQKELYSHTNTYINGLIVYDNVSILGKLQSLLLTIPYP
jgi:hypothetical protein